MANSSFSGSITLNFTAYGGSGKGNPRAVRAQKQPCGQFAYSASIAVPPLSTVIYTYTRPQRRAKRNINNP